MDFRVRGKMGGVSTGEFPGESWRRVEDRWRGVVEEEMGVEGGGGGGDGVGGGGGVQTTGKGGGSC